MKTRAGGCLSGFSRWCLIALAVLLTVALTGTDLYAFTINVVDDTGSNVTYGFRYLVEEDNTFCIQMGNTPNCVQPGIPNPNSANLADPSHTLAVNIHRSHAPVVCSGDTSTNKGLTVAPGSVDISTNPNCVIDPNKHYTVSVLPWHENGYNPPVANPGPPYNYVKGWTMSGRNVAQGMATSKTVGGEICTNLLSPSCRVDVVVHRFPMPTAQITVLVFHDNQPINGAPDEPAEPGLGGFLIKFNDPAGLTLQDAFANPLGTTYQYQTGCPTSPTNPKGICMDSQGNPLFVIDSTTGLPVVDYMGNGTLKSCPSGDAAYDAANCVDPISGTPLSVGEAVIRYLPQNKYTAEIVPPANDPNWHLTATLEGTRGNDAWVRAGEPRFNFNLGQLNWLVFYGFVKDCDAFNSSACDPFTYTPPAGTTGSISGRIVFTHDSHPPLAPGLNVGLPVPNCYVGLNNLDGADEQVYTAPCNADSTFQINNVPPGNYQLVVFDQEINAIIDFRSLVVPTGGAVNLGDVAVFRWFGTLQGTVFNDVNKNGFMDPGEVGVPNIIVNARFSDGSSYATATSDDSGSYSVNQFFPWWRWMAIEVDTTLYNSTGLTAVVDDGGVIPAGPYAALGINPQIQPDGLPYRIQTPTDTDAAITQVMLLNADMTNIIDFGKAALNPGENGGISGYVSYAITRTEEDPKNEVIDGWEPFVPRVTMKLYPAVFDPNAPNPEDPSGKGKWVPSGPAIQTVTSTSFDDNNPTDCVGCAPGVNCLWPQPEIVNGFAIRKCAENFRTWDQIRPGVFDGAYYFNNIPPGEYIVQAVTPKGYQVRKWGDRDIEFGDPKIPYQLYNPECVGPAYQVPHWHTLFPDLQVETTYPGPGQWYCQGTENPDGTCTGAAPQANSCSMKHVTLHDQQNAGANFALFTYVPKAARIWGSVWDDLHLESDPSSPNASGNLGAAWIPVSLKDYKGVEVARAYTDQWGRFTAMVPANYDIAPPIPLGLVLSMITIWPNDPGPILDTRVGSPTYGKYIKDPWFNPTYAQGEPTIRENWEFYSGKTTFVDTIVLPTAAVTGSAHLNCDQLNKIPEIYSVAGPYGGPLVSTGGGDHVVITSVGSVSIPNPDYPSVPGTSVTLDHGFGAVKGKVQLLDGNGNVVMDIPAGNIVWAADGSVINAMVPAAAPGEYQLVVTRGDNRASTTVSVTLHARADVFTNVFHVSPPAINCVGTACAVIQPVIDIAPNGSLILLAPGVYQENPILYKPVKLQGSGAPSTVFDGFAALDNLPLKDAWNTHFAQLQADGWVSIVGTAGGLGANFVFENGSGILVAACDYTTPGACSHGNDFNANPGALIDGLSLTAAYESGGGLYVMGYAPYLKISNTDIYSNQGALSGGIRLGTSSLTDPANAGNPAMPYFLSAHNENVTIAHNRIAMNGSLSAGGGGISLYNGSDNYRVTDNFICGNHAFNYGGGILHFGYSPNGLIARNKIISNESVDEGGGIMIAGELVPAGFPVTAVTQGSGSVTVDSNLIQSNHAGDDGGGLRTLLASGQDIQNNPSDMSQWTIINIFNNMIVDNSSADHGGGLSFDDTVVVNLINNTIANNDSTSTGSGAFGGGCVPGNPPGQVCPAEAENIGGLVSSIPRVGGIASYGFSSQLQAFVNLTNPAFGYSTKTFVDPVFYNDIIWHNRSFYWDATINSGLGGLQPITATGASSPYWDLAVYTGNATDTMSPRYSILTDGSGATFDVSNIVGNDPLFVKEFFNSYEATQMGAAFGNFVNVVFTPNGIGTTSPYGDYHIKVGSPAIDQGDSGILATSALLLKDYDGQTRPSPAALADIGADEFYLGTTTVPIVTSIGVYRPSNRIFYLAAGPTILAAQFGIAGDLPIVGDWDGNRTTTIGVFRPSNRMFFLRNSNSTGVADIAAQFGIPGDTPIVGDWDGNGTATIGIFRPSNRMFFLKNSNSTGVADISLTFGITGDIPIAGDWDGNGTTTIGVYRPSNNTFYLRNSNTTGTADIAVQFGSPGDIPVVGDWDGNGTVTVGVYRPSSSTFFLRNSNTNGAADVTLPFGITGDKPLAGRW